MIAGPANAWYIVADDMQTELEKSGEVPAPSKVMIVTFKGPGWNHFPAFLRETAQSVATTLANTALEYQIRPYQQAVPQEGDTAAQFFYRNIQRVGGTPELLGEMANSVMAGFSRTDELGYRHFSTAMHAGAKVLHTESVEKKFKEGDKKIIRTRIVARLDHYGVGYNAGFNQEGKWFWAVGLEDEQHAQVYETLTRSIHGIDVVGMMSREHVRDEAHGIDFTILS